MDSTAEERRTVRSSKPIPIGAQLRTRVNQHGPIPDHVPWLGHCWVWIGPVNRHGYGRISWRQKRFGAHRASYEHHIGPVPSDMNVLHRCDNPRCVRPDHLFLGTHADNVADAVSKGRMACGDRHGMRKHPERRATGARHGFNVHPELRMRGSAHANAKLSENQVIEIRGASESQSKMALRYGVSQTLISAIRRRKIWTHI